MKATFFAPLCCIIGLQLLSCSDEGCPDKYVRINGSCVVYTGNGVTTPGGGSAGQASGGSSGAVSGGSAAMAGASGSGKGGTNSTPQGGKPATGGGAAGAAGAAGSVTTEDGGMASGGAPDNEAAFGAACTTHGDCGGETNYCATPPTEPFYCTASGCDATPSLCPSGYECFDLGQFVPGEPFVCVKSPEVGNGAFGDVCNTSADCSGDTNYCAFSPTEPPYCSVSGCDAVPELCPADWTCFDVGQFVPGEPFICVKPAP